MARVHFGFAGEHGGLMAIYRRYRLGVEGRVERRFRTQFDVKELPSPDSGYAGLADLRFRPIVPWPEFD